MLDQENNENGLYVTYDSRYQLMKSKHKVEITIGDAGPLNLFKATGVIDLTPDDPTNDRYIDFLRALIHNNKEPVALSGDYQYNYAEYDNGDPIRNVHTPKNSAYGMRTAFYDAVTEVLYLSADNTTEVFQVGSIISHEFFGHLIQAMFGMRITDESNAMEEENYYNFHFNELQRRSADYDRGRIAVPPYTPIFIK
jgi:hypothetical protein